MGKTRAEWESDIRARQGDAWMEANKDRLDADWEEMFATFGD